MWRFRDRSGLREISVQGNSAIQQQGLYINPFWRDLGGAAVLSSAVIRPTDSLTEELREMQTMLGSMRYFQQSLPLLRYVKLR